ncbi:MULTISPECIES: L,D-transpeptidase [Kaistia]|uniref:L,D-transpeptidase n=1 Tax=Kaistia nematophila TaxID=2994654 RepID=A0A9X3IMR0_9HYPH|nr:L,D-transpeptidase [Kaistia nematophila]MCX5570771.1 L,D-transpeptidase [Kaistia nematophila]
MRSALQSVVLVGLAVFGLSVLPAKAQFYDGSDGYDDGYGRYERPYRYDRYDRYDRYRPRPPVMVEPEYGQPAWWMERPPYGAERRARRAPQQAGLMPRTSAPKAPKASRQFNPAFLPAVVDYHGREKPGTIVIDTETRYLYLVEANGTARRYGVGVGKPGFEWAGVHTITRKAEWPSWTPPAEMRARRPGLPVRMEGGLDNPLGSRALYLGSSLYRIHGSNEPWSIGHAVSSGCIRMRNQDVEDLYERVGIGTRVVVR